MKRIYVAVVGIALLVGVVGSVLLPTEAVYAQGATQFDPCSLDPSSSLCSDQNNKGDYKALIKGVVDLLLYIAGAAAVIMIIFAGLQYTTSGGNAEYVKKAKSRLMYAVVGLAIVLCAYPLVQWVYSLMTAG